MIKKHFYSEMTKKGKKELDLSVLLYKHKLGEFITYKIEDGEPGQCPIDPESWVIYTTLHTGYRGGRMVSPVHAPVQAKMLDWSGSPRIGRIYEFKVVNKPSVSIGNPILLAYERGRIK